MCVHCLFSPDLFALCDIHMFIRSICHGTKRRGGLQERVWALKFKNLQFQLLYKCHVFCLTGHIFSVEFFNGTRFGILPTVSYPYNERLTLYWVVTVKVLFRLIPMRICKWSPFMKNWWINIYLDNHTKTCSTQKASSFINLVNSELTCTWLENLKTACSGWKQNWIIVFK